MSTSRAVRGPRGCWGQPSPRATEGQRRPPKRLSVWAVLWVAGRPRGHFWFGSFYVKEPRGEQAPLLRPGLALRDTSRPGGVEGLGTLSQEGEDLTQSAHSGLETGSGHMGVWVVDSLAPGDW